MKNIITRLELKDEPFSTFKAASEIEINEIWDNIINVDNSLTQETPSKKQLKNHVSKLAMFFQKSFFINNLLYCTSQDLKNL